MDPRFLLLLLGALLCGGARPVHAQDAPVTVTCPSSPCQVNFTATLDASQAVAQLAAANAASIEDPTSVGVTTERMVQVFGGGFGLLWMFWGFGYGVGLAVNLIRKV